MSGPSNRHFRRGALSLDAAFVPDDTDGQFEMTQLVGSLGVGMLHFPGVLVPSGGPSPGYPFVEIGDFRQDPDVGVEDLPGDGMSSPPSHGDGEESHPVSQHHRHSVWPARGAPNNRDSATAVMDPGTDGPVAPVLGLQGSSGQGDTEDEAIAAAITASTTPPSYADLSDLVRQAVPELRREASPRAWPPEDNARGLPDDMFASPIRREQTRVDEATQASLSSEQGVEVTLPNGRTAPDDHSITGRLMAHIADPTPVATAGLEVGEKYRTMLIDPETAAGAPRYLAASMLINVGHGGRFNYQRRGDDSTGVTELPQYRDISNFNVGLFCQQAGLSLDETLTAAGRFARIFSRNAEPDRPYRSDPRTTEFIKAGYDAGRSRLFDLPPQDNDLQARIEVADEQ